MTRRGFLDASRVRHWLGGVEHAWTALTYESFNALRSEPSATNMALRLANDLTADELDASAVAHNTLVLLHHAAQARGLKLTVAGNLARSVVAEMIDLFDWPDFNKTEARQLNKVINAMAAARYWHYLVVTLRRRVGLGISGETDEVLRDPDQRCLGRAVGQRINGDGGKTPQTAALVRPA